MPRRHVLDLVRRRDGAAAVEFALVGPLLILLMVGMVVYGGWFWLAHGVQSLASEAARAAIGGLDAGERLALAQDHVAARAADMTGMADADLAVTVETTADAIRVVVAYDASGHPLLALSGLTPAPPMTIRRTAVIRTGGWS